MQACSWQPALGLLIPAFPSLKANSIRCLWYEDLNTSGRGQAEKLQPAPVNCWVLCVGWGATFPSSLHLPPPCPSKVLLQLWLAGKAWSKALHSPTFLQEPECSKRFKARHRFWAAYTKANAMDTTFFLWAYTNTLLLYVTEKPAPKKSV